ncbi:MAG: hypothetical protein PHY29_11410 [Syntrophales bacterium]|nr:hypothetical protein [Syntrophales bacterium]
MRKRFYLFLTAFVLVFLGQAAPVRCSSYEAAYIPWSGWWWPFTEGGLVNGSGYNGRPAPLEKYDYVTSGVYNGPATSYGRSRYYDPGALDWEGLCFPWSAASILEEEPAHKGIYNGTRFNVGDKKGLLTAAYDGVFYNYYPIGTPEEFHRVLTDYIGSQRTPIIMDIGTDGEIWNHPVFKYETQYTQTVNRRHYTTTIRYVFDNVDPDYVGSRVLETTYSYYFDVDGEEITASGWEGESVATHPKNAREPYPYPSGTQGSNTGIDFDEVIKIVTADGDVYKGNNSFEDAATLSSGFYPLILSTRRVEDPTPGWVTDSDYFKVPMNPGDVLCVRVKALEDDQGVVLRIYDPDRRLLRETGIEGNGSGAQTVPIDVPGEFTIEISPAAQTGEEPGYELFLRQELAHQGIFVLDPSGTWANGLALLHPDGREGKTIISQMDRDGYIQAGYPVPPGVCHMVGHARTFGLSSPAKGYLLVDSDMPVLGLQAVASGNSLLLGSNMISRDNACADIFFPHFAVDSGWKTYWGLINIGEEGETVRLNAYDPSGKLLNTDTIPLAPGQKIEYDAAYTPVLSSARTMRAFTESGRESLVGYLKPYNPSTIGRCLIPVLGEWEPSLMVPHVASDDYWTTDIAVMNVGDFDSDVRFQAYNAAGEPIGIAEHRLAAKQNFAMEASELFSDVVPEEIASVRIEAGDEQPLCGVLMYGSRNGLQLAGMPLHAGGSATLCLPHLACYNGWWTGIGLLNPNDAGTDVSFSIFDQQRTLLSLTTRRLEANQRMAVTVRNLFGDELTVSAKYLKIESSDGSPVSGIYLFGSSNGFLLMGDAIGFN